MNDAIPARIALAVENARLPANYRAAAAAIAECASIDECLDWADKAAALASYAKQREDVELENYCRRIRARASRRCGELLNELDDRGAHMKKEWHHLSRSEAAKQAGLSEHERKTVVRIARIPADEFEAQVESPHPPGTSILAKLGKQGRSHTEDFRQKIDGADLHAIRDQVKRREAAQALATLAHNTCELGPLIEFLLESETALSKVKAGLLFAGKIEEALKRAGVVTVAHLRPVK